MMGNSSRGSNIVNSTTGVIQGLESRYDMLLSDYAKEDLLIYKPEQEQLFDSAGHLGQATQQRSLMNNTQSTWQSYHRVQDQILQYIHNNQYPNAASLNFSQGEATFDNALNALGQLVQFDGRLVTYVQDATNIQERDELITTAVTIALIILSIGIIGALTYGTLVDRLRQLNKAARAVRHGQTDMRAIVDGRDEITEVSISINTMLDTIVGLLDETRVQRDAITNAAEHLFSDLHLVNGSKLVEIKTAANNDPIWMLSHAFNFTIGRLRRFVLSNQTTIEQLDIVSQRWLEKANTFFSNTHRLSRNVPSLQLPSGNLGNTNRKGNSEQLQASMVSGHTPFVNQTIEIRDQLRQSSRQNIEPLGSSLADLLEQASRLCQQVIAEQLARNTIPDYNTIQRLQSLEALIGHLGKTIQAFRNNVAKSLAEVYVKLNQLSTAAHSVSTENPQRIANSAGTSTDLTTSLLQEHIRLTEGFAREATEFAQSLRRIIEEMRANLVPFRPNTLQSSQQSNSAGGISSRGDSQ